MRRRTRLVLLAASVGLIAPVAINSSAASAVDQDLVVSVANGPAGTQIEVSSASCVTDDPESALERFLSAQLISGTAPNEVLAGAGSSFEDGTAVLTVPDWIDPADPAVIEARCIEIDFSAEEITEVVTPFDPVAFDVEVSVDPSVQATTFSRTSLKAGQGFAVDGEGCFLPGAEFGAVDVVAGDDLSGRNMGEYITSGGDFLDGDAFRALTAMSNGSFGWGISQSGDEPPEVEIVEETPTDIPAGIYTALPYCATEEGELLLFEPQLLEITGDAPFGDIDLIVAPESTVAEFVGGSCTVGNVEAELLGNDAAEILEELPFSAPADMAGSEALRRSAPTATAEAFASEAPEAPATDGLVRRSNATLLAANGGTKALADEGFLATTVTPDGSGAWALSDDAGFPIGVVEGYAFCGDPLEEGFLYDPQVAAVQVTPPAPTTTTTTTTTPPSPPANAVSGTPTYAG